jgi:EpsI family protein
MTRGLRWAPASILLVGVLMIASFGEQRVMPLRVPLTSAVPVNLAGFRGFDVPLSPGELSVAGVSNYLLRTYSVSVPGARRVREAFSVYIGYYEQQSQGRTIHSPRNCLPGAGWEPLTSAPVEIQTPQGAVTVNRYLLQRGKQRALVLYWYQGRGRVAHNEYLVKRDLLRDSALNGRSEEALVRVMVPIERDDDGAFRLASQVASVLIPAAGNALPL